MNRNIRIYAILDVEKYLDGVEGVIFDLDDTLYQEKDYVKSGYKEIAEHFPEIENMFEKLWNAFKQKKNPIDYVLMQEGCYSQENLEKALYIYRSHKPDIKLSTGVREMMQRIRETKKVGIITDGRPEGQRAKLEALGLNQLVDEVIITDELGGVKYRKPNDKAFKIMQNRLNIPFERMIYVGDNLKKDFTAPKQLGMQTIFFCNHNGLYGKRGRI